ncbi:MAG: AmmeMemoRadiSam system radical SAM enzyme [Spartobacteria bacterium]|nr:AmmeMemoRadiSam system radical SAM enzyme [Spartobacteria bacterium]
MMSGCTRRKFLSVCALGGLGAACGSAIPPAQGRPFRPDRKRVAPWREASFQKSLPDGRAQCLTCPNQCVVDEGGITTCRTRINRDGKLYTMTYGNPCVVFTDPLGKNPLYHVAPGNEAIGVGTAGCNLRCTYCQNWEFSQVGPDRTRNMELSPEELVKRAQQRNLAWITFSYTEPVAYYEYALATAKLAKSMDLKIAIVTAGYISSQPLAELIRYADAFSVTLKGYSEDFYRDVVGCPLQEVWKSIAHIARSSCWLEVVNLIIPTLNDEIEGIRRMARSLARLDPSIPLHFLRFSPAYKLKNLPVTPVETLEAAYHAARAEGLNYVYIDLPAHEAANTICPSCGHLLIQRAGFTILSNVIRNGHCPRCGAPIPGVDISPAI